MHGHWLLVRLMRLFPQAPFVPRRARSGAQSDRAEHRRRDSTSRPGRTSFERPYGLAWLLQLAAELREWDDAARARVVRDAAPAREAVTSRIYGWLPKLEYPIRIGEHNNTAFAVGLMWDWAAAATQLRVGN